MAVLNNATDVKLAGSSIDAVYLGGEQVWFGRNGLIRLLFGNGEQGVFYVPKPVVDGQQVLFTDAAGTIPVVADGDPVGYMQDLSGNDNHATQSTSAARHLYRSAINRLVADGDDDFIQASYSSAVSPPCVLSVAINRKSDDSSRIIATGLSTSSRHQLSISSSRALVGVAGSTAITSPNPGLGNMVLTLVVNGVDSQLRKDGVIVATGTLSGSSSGISLSSLWDGGGSIQQDVFGAVHAEGVDDIDKIEAYLANLAGVTL